MRKIIIVGTMHNMFPKFKNELISIIEKINPDQVFVEIDKKDLGTDEMKTYPSEMVFVYNWALNNKKQVDFFDVDMEVLKDGVSQEYENKIEKTWFKKYGKNNWKFFNKRTYKNRLDIWTIDKIIDKSKMNIRQRKMLSNIKKMARKKGTVLIFTGAYHLDFFEKCLTEAIFPFR